MSGLTARQQWNTVALSVVLVLIVAGALTHVIRDAHAAKLHRDVSFQYGETLMLDTIYGSLSGSADRACRAALKNPASLPGWLNISKAIAGCKYEEMTLDN